MTLLRLATVLCVAAACRGPDPVVAPPPETSVKPGINADFLDPALEVAKFEQRFEVESREIFVHRARIAALAGARAGQRIADIGAGTGLFTLMFATRVGPGGVVHAVDIAPRFVAHIEAAAATRGLANVRGVVCSERSVDLPPASIDVAFVCDTYHHFEYPQATLASIHEALRPGGELVVVDFIRIEGQSRPWILEHVRAGQEVVAAEIEAAGFRRLPAEPTPFLRENYVMRFVRP